MFLLGMSVLRMHSSVLTRYVCAEGAQQCYVGLC